VRSYNEDIFDKNISIDAARILTRPQGDQKGSSGRYGCGHGRRSQSGFWVRHGSNRNYYMRNNRHGCRRSN